MTQNRHVIKILYLVTEDWYFCSHRLPIARAAIKKGVQVTVVTRLSDKKSIFDNVGIKIVPIDIERSGTNPLKEMATIWKIKKIFDREQPDIVHLIALKPVILGGIAARLAGIKNKILAIAGMGFLFAEQDRGLFLQCIVSKLLAIISKNSQIIVQNPEDAAILLQSGVKDTQIHTIKGSGVDLSVYKPSPEPTGVPVVMLAARLLWDKGVGEFIEAARILKAKNITARFVLVGAPDPANPKSVTREDLRKWMKEEIIEWWGKKDNMHLVLPNAHVFCLPSYREGLPKVLLEAMACGRPCVTTDAPGCREAVRDRENGFLVKVRDAASLACALEKLILDAELRKKMGKKGREIAEKEFSVDKVVKQTMEIYKEILSVSGKSI